MSQQPQPIKMPHGSAAYPWTVTAYERADGLRVQARLPRTITRDQAEALLYAIQAAALAFFGEGTTQDTTPPPIAPENASQPGSGPAAEGRGGVET